LILETFRLVLAHHGLQLIENVPLETELGGDGRIVFEIGEIFRAFFK
jgi:hypothetical protein